LHQAPLSVISSHMTYEAMTSTKEEVGVIVWQTRKGIKHKLTTRDTGAEKANCL
jgi:hypothetical protein